MLTLKKRITLFCFGFVVAHSACAGIVLNATRVIYPSSEQEITVKMNNAGSAPALVQNWIDDGNVNASPDTLNVPFILTPPMNRVDPGKGQTLRIRYTGGNQPADRESLFWLNVLEVPPMHTDSVNPNHLQVAFRTRIKFFFRPAGLKSSQSASAEGLKWEVNGGGLLVRNNSPYYISLLEVRATHGGSVQKAPASMVAPYGTITVTLKSAAQLASGDKLSYDYLNDWGAVKTVDSRL